MREMLGIEELVERASQDWVSWTGSEPVLGSFPGVRELERWRLDAESDRTREVFLALGRLSQRPGTGEFATAVLAWLMVPGCEAVVWRRVVGYGPGAGVGYEDLVEVAVGALWEEVATYPWHEPLRGSIPMGIMRGVGRGLDREFGWGDRGDRVWRQRLYVEQSSSAEESLELGVERWSESSGEPIQASDVYWWAISEVRVSRVEMELLAQLATIASQDRIRAGASGGVTSMGVCRELGQRTGQSAVVVRRRANRALQQLRSHGV